MGGDLGPTKTSLRNHRLNLDPKPSANHKQDSCRYSHLLFLKHQILKHYQHPTKQHNLRNLKNHQQDQTPHATSRISRTSHRTLLHFVVHEADQHPILPQPPLLCLIHHHQALQHSFRHRHFTHHQHRRHSLPPKQYDKIRTYLQSTTTTTSWVNNQAIAAWATCPCTHRTAAQHRASAAAAATAFLLPSPQEAIQQQAQATQL